MAKDEKKFRFDKDERVLCFHGPLVYEAKIIKREKRDDPEEPEGSHYLVHYKGWKQTWDEWVPEERVLKYSDANLQKQQQLKETHLKRKPSRASANASTSTHPNDTTESRRKRNRDSSMDKTRTEDDIKRPEFKLSIPEVLKGLLVDDWENVTKNRQLVNLPREPTVDQILDYYRQDSRERRTMYGFHQPRPYFININRFFFHVRDDETLDEIIQGIKLYFNKTLGSSLLYRFEKKQFEKVHKDYPERAFSDIYGAEHLLRLFVEIPSLASQSNVDTDTLGQLRDSFTDLLRFLLDHEKEFFAGDYQPNLDYRER
ncbi:MRG-domain-containing protein [Phycomyces nitens]|nr:MRG-domain-containing protein [Phycomyces nitens]